MLVRTLVAYSLPAALLVACGSDDDAGTDAGSSPSASAEPTAVDHTPLSIPYALEKVRPYLEEAAQ